MYCALIAALGVASVAEGGQRNVLERFAGSFGVIAQDDDLKGADEVSSVGGFVGAGAGIVIDEVLLIVGVTHQFF
jgi:hypothetical protein